MYYVADLAVVLPVLRGVCLAGFGCLVVVCGVLRLTWGWRLRCLWLVICCGSACGLVYDVCVCAVLE